MYVCIAAALPDSVHSDFSDPEYVQMLRSQLPSYVINPADYAELTVEAPLTVWILIHTYIHTYIRTNRVDDTIK